MSTRCNTPLAGAVSTTEITVAAQSIVARLDVNLSTDTVEQLESCVGVEFRQTF